ncbi:MAG: hypothetical protein AB2814_07395 [Candidatus Sedimenticola endophacoides]
MEFSVTLTGYSEKDGRVLMELEPRWWDGRELIRDARFVKQGGRGLYRDYDADLDLDEVRELYTRYQETSTPPKGCSASGGCACHCRARSCARPSTAAAAAPTFGSTSNSAKPGSNGPHHRPARRQGREPG